MNLVAPHGGIYDLARLNASVSLPPCDKLDDPRQERITIVFELCESLVQV